MQCPQCLTLSAPSYQVGARSASVGCPYGNGTIRPMHTHGIMVTQGFVYVGSATLRSVSQAPSIGACRGAQPLCGFHHPSSPPEADASGASKICLRRNGRFQGVEERADADKSRPGFPLPAFAGTTEQCPPEEEWGLGCPQVSLRAPSTTQRCGVRDRRWDWLPLRGKSVPGFLFGEVLLLAAYAADSMVRASRRAGIDQPVMGDTTYFHDLRSFRYP